MQIRHKIRISLKILEASPGFGAPLTEQETKNFLTAGKLNVHLGTVDEKGDANIHPAWYFYDPLTNRIYVETSKQSKKTYNLRKKENVYFCIDDPNPPYKGARGKGNVKIHEDVNFNVPIAEKIMVKYLGNIEHPMAQALLDMQRKGQSVVLEISPKYYSTWDYSKK
jgi:general stress protein 26